MAKKVVSYLFVVLLGLVLALNYQLFVFPNDFAPAGLNGIFTMIQYLFGFKLSNASILLNLPLFPMFHLLDRCCFSDGIRPAKAEG